MPIVVCSLVWVAMLGWLGNQRARASCRALSTRSSLAVRVVTKPGWHALACTASAACRAPIGYRIVVTGTSRSSVTCEFVLERVAVDGAFVLFRDHLPVLERKMWLTRLRRIARANGIGLAIRDMGSIVLISTVGDRRIAQIGQALDELAAEDATQSEAPRPVDASWNHPSRGAHLRSVRNDD